METAFAWLSNLIDSIAALIPRLKIIRSTHGGVKFKNGKKPIEIRPGLIFYWPLTTEIEIIPTARQTNNLPSQCLLTKDGKTVVVGGVVIYSINDVVAGVSRNWSLDQTINDIAMISITKVITEHTLEYLQNNLTNSIAKSLTKEARARLKSYGVRVHKVALTDFSRCLVIRNMADG